MALLAVAAGCGRHPGLAEACQGLIDAAKYEAALPQCEQAYNTTRDPRAALAIARAHFGLGHDEQVVAWHDRLQGSSKERHVLDLVASSEIRAGRLGKAEDAYVRALALHRAAGDTAAASRALYGLFWIAWSSSRYRDALLRSREALAGSHRAEDHRTTGRIAEGLFTILYDVGDLDGAAAALRVAEEYEPSPPPDARARLLNDRGALLLERHRLRLARSSFEQAVAVVRKGGQSDFLRSVHLNLVEANVRLGDHARARRHLLAAIGHTDPDHQEAISLLYWRGRLELESGDPSAARSTLRRALAQEAGLDWTWRIEYEIGRAEELAGNRRAAEDQYGRASDRVEQMRAELGFDEFKGWLLERKRRPLEALFRLQASRNGGERAALHTFERAKARSFLDAFIAESIASTAGDPVVASLDRVDRLRALLPAMRESPVGALQPVESLLTALGGRQALAYFEAEGRLWIVNLRRGRVTIRPLDVSALEINDLVDRFLARPEDVALATRLGELLVPEDMLPPPESILRVVTDGPVARVPFAALRRQNRYLIEDHPIAYIPSLNALVAMERRPRPTDASAAVFIGDPSGDLPQASVELSTLAGRFRTTARTGATATRAALRSATRSPLVHLATHTGQGPGGPWLALSDGRVTAAQIVSERLGPRLVVLATCASATPRGQSLWGTLAAAFIAGGTDAVVASLWSVEDDATRELVLRFYDEGGASEPALALARAQRSFIGSNRPVSSWAPFVFVGPTSVEHGTN